MAIKSGEWIEKAAHEDGLIDPFVAGRLAHQGHRGNIAGDGDGDELSWGLDGCGYTIRLDNLDLIVFQDGARVSPKIRMDDWLMLRPGDCMLGWSIESLRMPPYVLGRFVAKSYYQRRFVYVSSAVCWPGWAGKMRIEAINHSRHTRFIRMGGGIGQLYFETVEDGRNLYRGQYQHQGEELGTKEG